MRIQVANVNIVFFCVLIQFKKTKNHKTNLPSLNHKNASKN